VERKLFMQVAEVVALGRHWEELVEVVAAE
jgi:hypothetical protein